MTPDLYGQNTPDRFWCAHARAEEWATAAAMAAAVLPPEARAASVDAVLEQTLGEGQFGPSHFRLGTVQGVYNSLKPVLPKPLTTVMKRWYGRHREGAFLLRWPIEDRFVSYRLDTARCLLEMTGRRTLPIKELWPDGHRYAFVLTHDIEKGDGQVFARRVADLDASFGFRSSFNFVPERYPLDMALMEHLRARGFEIGVHGLRHDGRDFATRDVFMRRAERINHYLAEFGAVGFRAPLTHRHPEWMQALDIEYDSSFFDTDPYEPIGGGTMSIWPFQLGGFVELPYTLAQDSTLALVLGETTPRPWLQKVEFLREYRGLVLLNTHPDYLRDETTWSMYAEFLAEMSRRGDFYHALPRDIARWWRDRPAEGASASLTFADGEAKISRSAPANPAGRYDASTADARSSA